MKHHVCVRSICFTVALAFCLLIPVQGDARAPVVLHLMTWAKPENINPIIESFQEAYPDIAVEVQFYASGSGYYDTIKTYMAAGVALDVFLLPYERVPEYAHEHMLLDLTAFAENDPTFTSYRDEYLPFLLEGYTYQDALYGLPWAFNPIMLFYNVNHMDNAGLEYPEEAPDWDDFADMAKKLTRASDDGPVTWGFTWNNRWHEFVWQNGGDVLDPTGIKRAFGRDVSVVPRLTA